MNEYFPAIRAFCTARPQDARFCCQVFSTPGTRRLLSLCLALLFSPGLARAALLGAAGKTDITPEKSVFLGGYGLNRSSDSVHDRLTARCLALESNGKRIAFVSCDLVGLPRYQIQKIRALVKSVPPANLIIAATHTHSGPDTLGQWGPDIRTSGVDSDWMNGAIAKIAALTDATIARLQPVSLKFAQGNDTGALSKNLRVPNVLDPQIGVMQAVALQDGKPIATLVNFACHPDMINSRAVSSDFPCWLYGTVEAGGGGICLYFNGALGGMISANFDNNAAPKGRNFAEAERIGATLGGEVLNLLKTAETRTEAPVTTRRSVFAIPMENPLFKAYLRLGVFPPALSKNGKTTGAMEIESEVNRIVIGPAEFVTIPGEALPNIGLSLKGKMRGKFKFPLGLACDELGYLLTPEDYGLPLYRYETQVSVGSRAGHLTEKNIGKMTNNE